ncbi:MAG TPA: hypothetical protein VNA24_21475 [Hyalangium sp.]|nr:hypothetical protein [Hyalangium sp.]
MTTPSAQISWKLFLALSLLLLVPGVSFAASKDAPLLATAEAEPPSLLSEQDMLGAQEKAQRTRRIHPALRVAAEIGAMSVTSVALAAGGVSLVLYTCDVWSTGWGCLDLAGYSMLGGIILGAPIGTWWGGKLTGGQGTFLGTLLGSGAGLLAGAGASLLVYNDNIKPFMFPLGAAIGSVVGYEVSHSLVSATRVAEASAAVQPVLAFSDRGAVLGLNGSF